MPTDVRATSPRQTSVRHVAHRRPSGARPTAVRAASAYLVTRGCSVRRCRLVPPDPTARPPSGARPARPLAAHAANARLVVHGCSMRRWRLVPPDPTARPPCGARPARPLAARAASFARRVVSKPGQAPQAPRRPPIGRACRCAWLARALRPLRRPPHQWGLVAVWWFSTADLEARPCPPDPPAPSSPAALG